MTVTIPTVTGTRGRRIAAYLRGFASVMDIRGDTRRRYRVGGDPAQVDAAALRADFEAVGADMRRAIGSYVPVRPETTHVPG